ncbi:hypothetical protein [Bartonella sp. B17]
MKILKHLFSTKRKQSAKKQLVATAMGYVRSGYGCEERFYNLYEYEDGAREYEEFEGCQYYETPEGANFSTEAQVKAWFYGSALPKAVLNYEPLIDEINKNIKKLSETVKKLSKSAGK